MKRTRLYCCRCNTTVKARLTNGVEIHSHRRDLAKVPFWVCDGCHNYVGCHYKDPSNPTKPLGCIPTPEIRAARTELHRLMDPLWKFGRYSRAGLYARISKEIGKEFHAGETRTVREVQEVRDIVLRLKKLNP